MARDFKANTASNINLPVNLISTTDPRPVSISIWAYLNNAPGTNNYPFFSNNFQDNNPGSGNPKLLVGLRTNTSTRAYLYSGTFLDSAGFTLTTKAWHHFGWSWNTTGGGGDAIKIYIDGAVSVSTTLVSGGDPTTAGAGLGCLTTPGTAGFFVDGSLAEFAVWKDILSDADFAALAAGVPASAIRPSTSVAYLPLDGVNSPEIDLGVPQQRWKVGSANGVAPVLSSAPPPPVMRPFNFTPAIALLSAPVPPPIRPKQWSWTGLRR